MRHSTDLEFYLARAAQARAEADAATLDHVRERCRRSEAAWTGLADRAARTIKMRTEHERLKAAEAAQLMKHENNLQENGPPGPQDPRASGQA
jgi:hypothetical protein